MRIKRTLSLALALVLLTALICPASYAAQQRYSDVAPSHWAYETIDAIADGGIVVGYPDGTFQPSKSISRAELATIVARIKGYDAEVYDRVSDSTYWAYEALDYCINVSQCMPSFGDITPENYNVPCTRELAASVLVNGIGSKNPDKYNPNVKAEDIPDLYKVGWTYQNDVLKAYQLGLVNGMDDKGTFEPQGEFTRAQVATILLNSGYTTAADKPEGEASKTLAQAWEEIKAMGIWSDVQTSYDSDGFNPETGEVYWNDTIRAYRLTGIDAAKGINIIYQQPQGEVVPERISIIMVEQPTTASANGYKDYLGNTFTWETVYSGNDTYKDTEIYALPSGYHYNSRQIVKQLMGILLPAAQEDAYTALKEVMLQEVYEGSNGIATANRWLDGHYVKIYFDDPANWVFIDVFVENNEKLYTDALSIPGVGYRLKYYSGVAAGFTEDFIKAFELDKW